MAIHDPQIAITFFSDITERQIAIAYLAIK